MPIRLRKFIGTILIIVLVLVYALVANTIAVATLGNAPWCTSGCRTAAGASGI